VAVLVVVVVVVVWMGAGVWGERGEGGCELVTIVPDV
jgi:hypothetical protein